MTAVTSTALRYRLEDVAERLEAAGIEAPQIEAEGLVSAVLGIKHRHSLYGEERDLSLEEIEKLDKIVQRRLEGEPLQYITGEAAFRLLTLKVDRRALIPRPETEGLVEVVLQLMGSNQQAVALDAGTGCGPIALSLAMECPAWSVLAMDASPAALELAQENADRYDLRNIQWFEADITKLDFWRMMPPLDLLISNPPYVKEEEWDDLDPEIREHEPRAALVAGEDGLDVIAPLLDGASMRIKPGGLLAMEIGESQGEEVMELARSVGLADIRVAPDLSGRPRYLIARQPLGLS
jgi:release factor glutamine methyltransferase